MQQRPMFVEELAARLGYSPDYFRRHIDRLIIECRMPPPLPVFGWRRWDRGAIEAWLKGHLQPRAANDAAPLDPTDIESQRVELQRAYGRAG